ncbi:MAG: hypothetical protein ACXVCP_13875 [Bdellovibrio sp.]
MLKKIIIVSLTSLVFPIASFATCYEGNFKVSVGATDLDGKSHSAQYVFRAEMPTKDEEGKFESALVNGDEAVNYEIKGKKMGKLSDIFTPDNLTLVKPDYTVRCPCEVAESADRKITLSIETRGDRSLSAIFLDYFGHRNLEIENISECK